MRPFIRDEDRPKPLTYDPETDTFITYDDLVEGRARPVSIASLDRSQLERLVVERQRVGPDYSMGDLTGRTLTRDEVVAEIEARTEFGNMVVDAEVSYLTDFLAQVSRVIESK